MPKDFGRRYFRMTVVLASAVAAVALALHARPTHAEARPTTGSIRRATSK